jgi:hypothetical protein
MTCIVNIICLWFKHRVVRSKLRTYLYINLISMVLLQWLSNILHAIKNIYHFKDPLSYCIPSLWYLKKRYNSPYNKTLKNSIFTLRWSNFKFLFVFWFFLQKFEYCYNNGIQCKFHDLIDAENVITLSIL